MPEACRDRPTSVPMNIFFAYKSPKYYYDYDAMAEPMKEVSKKRYTRKKSGQQIFKRRCRIKVQKSMKQEGMESIKGITFRSFAIKEIFDYQYHILLEAIIMQHFHRNLLRFV